MRKHIILGFAFLFAGLTFASKRIASPVKDAPVKAPAALSKPGFSWTRILGL